MKQGDEVQRVAEVSRFLGNVTITCKGVSDIITDGNNGKTLTYSPGAVPLISLYSLQI